MNPNEPSGNPINFIRSSARQSDPQESQTPDQEYLSPGAVVGGYEILSFVGVGGMSTVYKARAVKGGKIVAIKMMHRHLVSDVTHQKRFEHEAKTVEQLDHPHIIRVYECGVGDNEQSYLIMDYLEGISLSDTIAKEGPMELDRAITIFIQAADALEHAHRCGVIHRDLKPSNIMLSRSPRYGGDFVKLLDFGMAKFLPSEGIKQQYLTKTGEVFGSPLYMAPEQCMGKSLDERCDIYSMGCLMYEVLTGSPPLMGSNVWETFNKQVHEMPEPISAKLGQKDRLMLMDTIILKCMAKAPKDRYSSMHQLSQALEEVTKQTASGIFSQIRNDILLQKAIRGAQKKPKDAGKAIVAALSGLTIMVLGFVWYAMHSFNNENLAVTGSLDEYWQKANMQGQRFFDSGQYAKAAELFSQAAKTLKSRDRFDLTIPALLHLLDLSRVQGQDQFGHDCQAEIDSTQKLRASQCQDLQNVLLSRLTAAQDDKVKLASILAEIHEHAAHDLAAKAPDRLLLTKANELSAKLDKKSFARDAAEDLAALDISAGKTDDAEKSLRSLIEESSDDKKDVPTRAYKMLIARLLDHDKYDQAKTMANQLLGQAIDISESTEIVPWCKCILARAAMHEGDYAKAEKLLDAARASYELDKSSELGEAECLLLLAQCQAQISPDSQDETLLSNALAHAESGMSTDNAEAPSLVSGILTLEGDFKAGPQKEMAKAETLYLRAIFVAMRPDAENSARVAEAMTKLSELYGALKKQDQFAVITKRVLSIDTSAGNSSAVASDYACLAKIAEHADPKAAEAYYEKALTFRPATEMARCDVLARLARLHLAMNQTPAASDLLDQAITIIEKHKDEAKQAPDTVRMALSQYVDVMSDAHQDEKAKKAKDLLAELTE